MGRKTGDYLTPSSDIGEYSIGADLVLRNLDPEYVANGITALRGNTKTLLESTEHDDLAAIGRINEYFARNDYRLASYELGLSLDRPFSRQHIVEWLATATDEDVKLFCRWSLERTLDLTKALRRDRQQLDVHTLEKTEKLANIGLFPRFAVAVTDRAMRSYVLQGMDAFHSGGIPCVGFCTDHVIGLANLYVNRKELLTPSREMKQVAFHENMHAAGRDRGFFWGISTPLPMLRVVEEAFVEHATDVAHSRVFKQPHIIDPKQRQHIFKAYQGPYLPERTFLATVCDQTRISAEQLGEAYFRPRGDERGEWLREGIERKIGQCFGGKEHFFAFVRDYEEADNTTRKRLIHDTTNQLKQHA